MQRKRAERSAKKNGSRYRLVIRCMVWRMRSILSIASNGGGSGNGNGEKAVAVRPSTGMRSECATMGVKKCGVDVCVSLVECSEGRCCGESVILPGIVVCFFLVSARNVRACGLSDDLWHLHVHLRRMFASVWKG